ncbi:extracellular solute-binding protein [Paenibacillus koleovorans]|uniref:extracellular solute-binding protein n=1 Tax=Paenibacillus koleovorans TaxID=121608 RepID=UPI000FDA66BD|nr:extracellular solute-binding protein [Paenibacillus koleovorans]
MQKKKWWTSSMTLVLAVTVLTACSGGGSSPSSETTATASPSVKPKEVVYVEVAGNTGDAGANDLTKDDPWVKWIAEKTGVGYTVKYVAWDGGNGYAQRLNTRISTGDLPDLFLPWGGVETSLIKQGALVELSKYLPQYAPHIWNGIPKEIWDVVRTSDPSGKGGIYYIPRVELYNGYGAHIRKDWLDRVGKPIPKTQEEYVDVLRAFLKEDANGNGDPNDEIPVSGREFGRWMDHLFGMYGVAIWEGLPQWDIYNGELTYSAVTPNMRDAILFIRQLYKEKLLDNETFLNSGAEWLNRIHADKIGSFFSLPRNANQRLDSIVKTNPKAELVYLPLPKVKGYNGFVTYTRINRPEWVIANKNEATTIAALKLLEFYHDPANTNDVLNGLEGIDHKVVNGKVQLIPIDAAKRPSRVLANIITDLPLVQARFAQELDSVDESRKKLFQMRDQMVIDSQKDGKPIAGDGIPATIYDNYPDIRKHTMFQEVMTKIVIGAEPIEKFDEFVELWNKSGGKEVTARARAWYKQMH